ncbi:MAG: TolC family protein [Puniceicoccales bacterium]|jgi:outer membrane protein TolC|nr:TolC family protein [Puniceicoccales bacterium]
MREDLSHKRNRRRWSAPSAIALCVLIAAAGGCASGGKSTTGGDAGNPPRTAVSAPEKPPPASLAAPSPARSEVPAVRPETPTAPGDPVLEKLLRHAAANSPDMLEAAIIIEQNDAFRHRGWRPWMPFLTAWANAGQFKIFPTETQDGDDLFNAAYGVTLRYPLFTWGAVRAERKAGLLREKRAQTDAIVAWNRLVASLRAAYYEAVALRSKMDLQERQIAVERRRQSGSDNSLATGDISETERLGRSVALREREYELGATKLVFANLVQRLRSLSGLADLRAEEIPSTTAFPRVDCDALERRLASVFPQLTATGTGGDAGARRDAAAATAPGHEFTEERVARIQREILDHEITQARARTLPILSVSASYTQNPYDAGWGYKRNPTTGVNERYHYGYEMRDVMFAGVNVTWNILDRDASNAAVRALKAQQRLIDARLVRGRADRLNNLRTQIAQIRRSQEMLVLRASHLDSALRNLAALRQALTLGTVDELSVENAELAMLNIQSGIAADQIALARAYREFLAAIEQDPASALYTPPEND